MKNKNLNADTDLYLPFRLTPLIKDPVTGGVVDPVTEGLFHKHTRLQKMLSER